MNNYLYEVEETLTKQVSIKAESEEQAYKILKHLYNKGEIVLDDTNYIDSEFNYIMIDNTNKEDYSIEDIEGEI